MLIQKFLEIVKKKIKEKKLNIQMFQNRATLNEIYIDSFKISHHALRSHSFPSPSISTLYPCSVLPKEKLKQ